MSLTEIRLIAYAVLALGLMGGSAWGAHEITSWHYEALMGRDKDAQKTALLNAQQKVIAAQAAQKAAEQQVETEHELRTQADTVSRAAVLSSVRGLETAIHSRLLPAAVANTGAGQANQSGGGGTTGLAGLVDRFNASLDRFIAACQNVDNDRTTIISIEPKVTP